MKINKSYATETFLNAEGYYCISQEEGVDDACVVVLTPSQMRLLVDDMMNHLENNALLMEEVMGKGV